MNVNFLLGHPVLAVNFPEKGLIVEASREACKSLLKWNDFRRQDLSYILHHRKILEVVREPGHCVTG